MNKKYFKVELIELIKLENKIFELEKKNKKQKKIFLNTKFLFC